MLNGAGQTAFRGWLDGPGVDGSNYEGIWSEGHGSGLALVARSGNPAPGTADGVNFGSAGFGAFTFKKPVLNSSGQTAFLGTLTGSGVISANATGIWSEGGGSGLALVAREGDQAPGLATGANLDRLSDPVLNGAGQTAFRGYLTGPVVDPTKNEAIGSEGSGSGLTLVALRGSQAPGTAAGVNFSGFGFVALNGVGQIAFVGALTGAGVTSSKDEGIWATGYNGLLRLVVRKGDLLDVSNNPLSPDLRRISSLKMFYGSLDEDGRGTSFNDRGQLAFRASFTDGSAGIFVATIANSFTVTMVPAVSPGTGYDFTWESRSGKVYDLVTSTDPVTPVSQWPVHAAYSDIPATGTTTTLTAVPVAGPQRFFTVIEKDAPLVD